MTVTTRRNARSFQELLYFCCHAVVGKPNFGALLNSIGAPETELIQSDDELRTVCALRHRIQASRQGFALRRGRLWRCRLIAGLRSDSEDHCGTASERAKVLLSCRIEARTLMIASVRAACLPQAASIDDRTSGGRCAMDSS